MANIKFSQFTQKTTLGNVDFLVGYTGAQNIQIDPADLLSDYSQGTGAAGQVTFFSATSTVTGDNDFYWDNTNKRLGVGTTSPDRKFEVASTGTGEMCITGATGSRLYFRPTTSYSPGGNFGILVTGSGGPSYLSTMTITGYNNGLNTVMTLKGDGNVGIGTASPAAKLHVDGTLIATGISQLGSGGSNVLLTSSSAGNVGIGDSSPTAKLVVNNVGTKMLELKRGGNIKFRFLADSNDGQLNVFNSAVSNKVRLHTNGDSYFNGGNVGIGTSSPSANLEIDGGSSNAFIQFTTPNTNYAGIRFGDPQSTNAGRIQYYHGDASMQFDTEGKFTFEGGNVGIGTTSPGVPLDVFGSDGIRTTTNSGAFAAGYFAQMRSDYGANALRLTSRAGDVFRATDFGQAVSILTGTTSSGTSERLHITSAGDVGIGTNNPSVNLEIGSSGSADTEFLMQSDQAGKYFKVSSSGNFTELKSTGDQNLFLNSSGAGGYISFLAGNSERMRINYNGNVGIGTTSPSQKLHVNGAVLFDGFAGGSTVGLNVGGAGNGQIRARHLEGKQSNTSSLGDLLMNYYSSGNIIIGIGGGNVGIGTTSPASKLEVDGGDIEVDDSASGLILRSPDGTRYRVTVANGGTLSVSAV